MQPGHRRDKSSAVFLGKRLDDDFVMRTLTHVVSIPQEGYLSGLGNLVTSTTRWSALCAVHCANRLDVLDTPSGWILLHVVQSDATHGRPQLSKEVRRA